MKEKLIFISYAHKDSDSVLPVIASLLQEGYNVWFDEGIEAGTEWPATIETKLSESSLVIAFISNASIESQNCRNEINYATSLGKEILTVYLEDAKLAVGMNLQLGSLQAMFKYRHKSDESFITSLLTSDIIKRQGMAVSAKTEERTERSISENETYSFISELKAAKLKSAVKFGNYPSFSSMPTPIEWIVLEKQYGVALLLSKYILDAVDFGEDPSWDKSNVRKWLNGSFYGSAFSLSEKKYILESERFTETISENTKSKESVFLLERREIKKYFGLFNSKLRVGIPTPHAIRNGVPDKNCYWWLRSSHLIHYACPQNNKPKSFYPRPLKGDYSAGYSYIAPVFPYHHVMAGTSAMGMMRFYHSERRIGGIGVRPAILVRYE